MDVYRTPEERFGDLPGYPYRPNYFEWEGLRLHYVDEGSGRPILLLHGEPDWSYLYRRMLPILAARFRVVAPDYAGFGRSDKPTDIGWYSYDRHVASVAALIEHLGLEAITLVVQDWGGPIGLRAAVESRERFARLVVMNTGLFTGADWPTPGFLRWRAFAERTGLDLPVGRVMEASVVRPLDQATLAAYEAPWPVRESKAGVAAFPLLVPISQDHPDAGVLRWVADELRAWPVPALVAWSDQDPVFTPEHGRAMAEALPGADGVWVVEGAGHMLQEDRGEAIAERIVEWMARLHD
ncbi:MAG: haloalkane dehalogenase [Candidatus Dormibacteraeota bacterium]|nr:haloalkane dehalogenase [Candidatus Dormibacteraeota bacterium]